MARTPLVLLTSLGALTALAGCPSSSPRADSSATTSATPSATAASPAATAPSAAATPSAAPSAAPSAQPPLEPPSCKTSNQKVWGAGANKLTGLTTRNMPNNQVAIGLALGVTPHVLVVNKGGGGQMRKVETKGGSLFATPPKPGEGYRKVMRVTPSSIDEG
ncbi:MAG: hypothetical protein MUF64_30320 [Polyangiaceae bacterium]|nr:hypothetical protein [Polyangiaceae bacterium]